MKTKITSILFIAALAVPACMAEVSDDYASDVVEPEVNTSFGIQSAYLMMQRPAAPQPAMRSMTPSAAGAPDVRMAVAEHLRQFWSRPGPTGSRLQATAANAIDRYARLGANLAISAKVFSGRLGAISRPRLIPFCDDHLPIDATTATCITDFLDSDYEDQGEQLSVNLMPLLLAENLRSLHVAGPRVQSWEILAAMKGLQTLTVHTCTSDGDCGQPEQCDTKFPAVDLLAQLPNLRALDLDTYMETLEIDVTRLKGLTSLRAHGDIGLSGLGNLNALKTLDLMYVDLIGGFEGVRFKQLETIHAYILDGGEGLVEAAASPALIELHTNSMDDAALEALGKNAPNLRKLYVSHTKLSSLAPLAHMTQLEELDISQTEVADLSPLKRLRKLKVLRIGGTQVADLRALAGLRSLTTLGVDELKHKIDLRPLSRLRKLKHLNLDGTQIVSLAPVKALRLERLSLRSTNTRSLRSLRGLSSTLLELNLGDGNLFTSLASLPHMRKLERLDLTGSNIEPSDARTYRALMRQPRLKFVDFVHESFYYCDQGMDRSEDAELRDNAACRLLDALDKRDVVVNFEPMGCGC